MSIDWSKPIQTKDGRKAELLKTLKNDVVKWPHVVYVDGVNYDYITHAKDSGETNTSTELENAPERFSFERWVNVYPDGRVYDFGGSTSRAAADRVADNSRIACIRVTIAGNVGQFDE